MAQRITLTAPVSGVIMPLTEVPDPVFAQKMLGDGVAIDPTNEMLLAPCAGTVTQIHSAHHALTITTKEGLEVLMHIGLETVLLKGRGFTPKAKEGNKVKPGDPLIAFDADFLVHNAASLVTIMIISNGEKVASYQPVSTGLAEAGKSVVLEVVPVESSSIPEDKDTEQADPKKLIVSEPILILNVAGLHARPSAVLVNSAKQFSADIKINKDGRSANAKSLVSVMGLEIKQHDQITLSARGEDAKKALETLVPLITMGLGENLHAPPPEPRKEPIPEKPKASGDPNILLGVSASPGLAIGQIFQMRQTSIKVEKQGKGVENERQALAAALDKAKKELEELQDKMRRQADAGKAAIFAAHQELLEDPELLESTQQGIEAGQSAAFAWEAAFTQQAETLQKLNNELLAARANDVRDVGRRVLKHLAKTEETTLEMPANVILIAQELTPSDTANLDKGKVLGFCTAGGSSTSHVAILARSASIPAIAAIEERALEIPNGTFALLNGDRGLLRLNPSEEEKERVRKLQEKTAKAREIELSEAATPAVTRDGHRIKVVGNIGSVSGAEEIPSLGGEGVGLLRSEFLFLQRTEAPDEEEQAAAYTSIAKILGPDRDFVVRTLDVGGDKPLAYLPIPPEANPFLGIRGIRLNLLGTDLFLTQVRAALGAAAYTRLCIMFPMVASIEELRAAKELVLKEKETQGIKEPVQIGIMVEVPAAAILAEGLAKEADFFSIGTNDLTQYTLAMDRGHPRLAKMADALHPAVLNLIHGTVEGAHKHGKWVGVCGGLAGEVLAVPALLGLGVDELSVAAASIPTIKAAVRRQNLPDCQSLAKELLAMQTASEVRERLTAYQGKL